MSILVHTPPGATFEELGVSHVRVTVEGGDLSAAIVDTFPYDLRTGSLGAIPYGHARQVTVEALAPAGGDGAQTVLARGRSLPTDVPVGQRAAVHVYVAPVDRFFEATSFAAGGAPSALNDGRVGHTTTVLADGRVLIAGGAALKINTAGELAIDQIFDSLEIYDPATGAMETLPVRLYPGRAFHTATRLRGTQGYVLIAGGMTFIETRLVSLQVSDVFNPEGPGGGTLFLTNDLWTPRARHQATLRHDGSVLITGGAWINDGNPSAFDDFSGNSSVLASAELFRVQENRAQARGCNHTEWTYCVQPAMSTPRVDHASVRVGDAVMVVGGRNGDDGPLGTTEMFKFDTADTSVNEGAFASGPRLREPRVHAAVVRRSDDVVVVAGGEGYENVDGRTGPLKTIETYDPVYPGGQFSMSVTTLDVGRARPAAAVLPDDSVIVTGGAGEDGAYLGGGLILEAADSGVAGVRELNPSGLTDARADATAVTLDNGGVLLLGGRTRANETTYDYPTSVFTFMP